MRRVDLAVAVAAGLAVVFPLYQIFTLPEMCDSPRLAHGESFALLAALASYLIAPLLFGRLRNRRGARLVWLRTSILGSLLCAVALYFLVTVKDWGLAPFAIVWLALCAWTLPFAAAVYYPVMIFKWGKKTA